MPSFDELLQKYSGKTQQLIELDLLRSVYQAWNSVPPEDKKNRQRRGYVFQNMIYSILHYEGLNPRTSYRPPGEEIDGAFYVDHRTFLLEAKWTADPIPASVLYEFKGKVDGKLIGTLGIFISMSGYSEGAVDAFEKGKTTNVVLFEQPDMDTIFFHGIKFMEVLDFKLRQAGEVGKTCVAFDLPKEIAKVRAGDTTVVAPPSRGKASEYAQVDIGYGKALILILCEGHTDAFVLENIFQKLIAGKLMYSNVAIEIKSMGGSFPMLERLPEMINIFLNRSELRLSGVVLVLDTDASDFTHVSQLGKRVEEYISKMAIPVPVHLSFAIPTIEAWVGLDKEKLPSGVDMRRLLKDALNKLDPPELLSIKEVKATIDFIREIAKYEGPLWEADARKAVERALDNAQWDPESGVVTIQPMEDKEPTTECASIDELRTELTQIASIGASNSMPYEEGEPVVDIDYDSLVDEILVDQYGEQIGKMGWEL